MRIITLIALLLAGPALATPLDADTKKLMEPTLRGNCIRDAKKNNAVTATLSAADIESYCGCMATRTLDEMQNEDVTALMNPVSARGRAFKARIQSFASTCLQSKTDAESPQHIPEPVIPPELPPPVEPPVVNP